MRQFCGENTIIRFFLGSVVEAEGSGRVLHITEERKGKKNHVGPGPMWYVLTFFVRRLHDGQLADVVSFSRYSKSDVKNLNSCSVV